MRLPSPNEGGAFEKVGEGTWAAICYRVVDLGTQKTTYKGTSKEQHKIRLDFEVHDPDQQTADGRPMVIGERYTLSMFDNAALRKQLETWRGRSFQDAELGPNGTFQLENLLGVPALISVVHTDKGDRSYANITGIAKLPSQMRGTLPDKPHNEPVFFSLEADEFDQAVYDALPEWLRKIIADSPEYQAIAHAQRNGSKSVPGRSGSKEAASAYDDEIPF